MTRRASPPCPDTALYSTPRLNTMGDTQPGVEAIHPRSFS